MTFISRTKNMFSILALALCLGAVPAFASDNAAGEQHSDTWIKASIVTRYTVNKHLNPFKIDVDVNQGAVTLRGKVAKKIDKDLAEQIALGVEGVRDVHNKLTVDGNAAKASSSGGVMDTVRDSAITAKVKSKLLLNDNTHGLDIKVDTTGRVVTLKGNVSSDAERQLAEQITRNTDGVTDVRNDLVISGKNR